MSSTTIEPNAISYLAKSINIGIKAFIEEYVKNTARFLPNRDSRLLLANMLHDTKEEDLVIEADDSVVIDYRGFKITINLTQLGESK